MKAGFKGLDEIINLEEPQLILLTGTNCIEELSGDVANNVCLKQECEVLEVVSCKKEYLIKRLLVNQANVNYKNWCNKNEYTEQELQQIGQSTVNLIEVTKRLPTIIEQELYDLGDIIKLVSDFANHYADRETVDALVVLDISHFNSRYSSSNTNTYRVEKFIKQLKKISTKLRCPILLVNNIENKKIYNRENNTRNYITKDYINNIKVMNKYVDTFIITNVDETVDIENSRVYDVDVYNTNEKIGTCKLKYDFRCRKFIDY